MSILYFLQPLSQDLKQVAIVIRPQREFRGRVRGPGNAPARNPWLLHKALIPREQHPLRKVSPARLPLRLDKVGSEVKLVRLTPQNRAQVQVEVADVHRQNAIGL
jgi:hypothetical protein